MFSPRLCSRASLSGKKARTELCQCPILKSCNTLYSEESRTGGDCENPLMFWFCSLTLCLQWFLLCVVLAWYQLETSVGDVHHEEEHCEAGGISKEEDETLFSFPAPV